MLRSIDLYYQVQEIRRCMYDAEPFLRYASNILGGNPNPETEMNNRSKNDYWRLAWQLYHWTE